MKIQEMNLAVIGATGAVGREVIRILENKKLHPKSIRFAASKKSAGGKITFNNATFVVEELTETFFQGIDVAICSAGSAVSKKFINPENLKQTIVIDNCSFHRMDPEIPLVIPEINSSELNHRPKKSIIANPNCTTIAMLVPLNNIHKQFTIEKIICSSYQSVSGAGQNGINELNSQIFDKEKTKSEVFPQRISFNLIPNIGGFQESTYTIEEQKMVNETKKIFGDSSIQVAPTCVRVPTFVGHGLSLYVETKEHIDLFRARNILVESAGVTLMDEPTKGIYPTLADCQGKDDVIVGRLRKGMIPNSFQLWVVSDNLRKGAALNAVQILETLLTKSWL